MSDAIQIIMPPVAETPLDDMLVELTRLISLKSPDIIAHGCLGGEFGYGARFENEVFVMRPYYWGDCDCGWEQNKHEWSENHKHSADCYWTLYHATRENEYEAKRNEAIKGRDKLRWFSPEQDAVQQEVLKWSDKSKEYRETIAKSLCERFGIPWNNGYGSAVHCTCGHDLEWRAFFADGGGHKTTCSLELPNFLHKKSRFEVRWYKWIGRDMEIKNQPVNLTAIFDECRKSLGAAA